MSNYNWYKPKKTPMQKVKGFFRKVFFASAALGGVAGAGYHHYGTDETLVATITSVDVTPAKDAGNAPEMTIHTDRGTFVNSPSLLHWKSNKDAIAMGETFKIGVRIQFTVYGMHPNVLGFTPDSLGIHRNITDAKVVPWGYELPKPQPKPVAAPLPLPHQQQPQQPPAATAGGFRTVEGVTAEADNALPQVCGDMNNLESLRADAPQLYRDLSLMERLPLTGKPVFDFVTGRDAMLRGCLIPDAGDSLRGAYSNHVLRATRGDATGTTMHEAFHALQDKNGDTLSGMTHATAIVGNALTEAAAVGYELMAAREAKNKGIDLPARSKPAEGVPVFVGASDNPAIQYAFNRAYDSVVKAGGTEAAALQAGGTAVVRALLLGDDENWLRTYAVMVINNINGNSRLLDPHAGSTAGYNEKRKAAYLSQGQIGSMNITPAELRDGNVDAVESRIVAIMGINVPAPAPKPAAKTAPSI